MYYVLHVPRNTLIDFFEDFATIDRPFLVHDDGYRVREVSYRELANAARAFASRLTIAGIRADDKVVIWSENRPEWLVALWGCLLARVVLVPVDYRASRRSRRPYLRHRRGESRAGRHRSAGTGGGDGRRCGSSRTFR